MWRRSCLVGTGPGRRCVAEEAQRPVGGRAELEVPARRDDKRVAGFDGHRLDARRVGFRRATPDLSFALEEEPDLFHVLVPHRPRGRMRAERRLAQAGGSGALRFTGQQPDLGSVRGLIRRVRQAPDRRLLRISKISSVEATSAKLARARRVNWIENPCTEASWTNSSRYPTSGGWL